MQGFDILNVVVWGTFFAIILVKFYKSLCLVPTKVNFIVERLGKYHVTLQAGFHALIPFLDRVVDRVSLKEETIEVPPQDCFSKDEINVEVDGVIYLSVVDPLKACYGITNYRYAAIQLAQTTIRSVIGTLELDRTFEERDVISAKVVDVLTKAGESWGIRVFRYEIKNIIPPSSVKQSMEKQVTAERTRRAILEQSEGDKQAKINMSEGKKAEMINISEGEMRKRINDAEGHASEILTISKATADSIHKVAKVMDSKGGKEAIKLQVTERLFSKLSNLADARTRVILPVDLADYNSWLKNLDLDIDA